MGLLDARNLEIAVIVDNFYDGLLPSASDVERYGLVQGGGIAPPLHAEHGLSYLISWDADRRHKILVDFGLSGTGVRDNVARMGLDLSDVEALCLSHGHFDHFLGLAELLPLLPRGIPFYAGNDVFRHRYLSLGGTRHDLGQLSRDLLGDFDVRLLREPAEILPGAIASGPIQRRTSFEKGSPSSFVATDEGLRPDDFPGEQALGFPTEDGLVVVSSCAHAGIVNTVLHLRDVSGVRHVRAAIGGFHLSGAPAEKIAATVSAMRDIGPDRLVPMHCTGPDAERLFHAEMPEATAVNAAGSRWHF